jgi:hypothetical protein
MLRMLSGSCSCPPALAGNIGCELQLLLELEAYTRSFVGDLWCGFPQTSPITTLKTFGVGNDLPYSAPASAWAEQHREELRNAI